MPLSFDSADRLLATFRQNAGVVAQSLSTALDAPISIEAEKVELFRYASSPPEWNGPGLAIVLKVDSAAALLLIAASSGLVPSWIMQPGKAGQSKLEALAQEVGRALLPPDLGAAEFTAGYVENLGEAVTRGSIADAVGALHCVLKSNDKAGAIRMIWPALSPEAVLAGDGASGAGRWAAALAQAGSADINGDSQSSEQYQRLPAYIRSLLRISVPVSVQLASIKQPVSRILNIGPGSIIQFEKNCERPLSLCVGNQVVAEGDAVKVGDKFGLKITQMVLPGERFFALRGKRA